MGQGTAKSVPPCKWPDSAATKVVLTLMMVQGVVCLIPESSYPFPVHFLLAPLQREVLRIMGSHTAMRWFFGMTYVVHSLEAIYGIILIYRTLNGRFGGTQSILWTLQTVLLGITSLRQLCHELDSSTSCTTNHDE